MTTTQTAETTITAMDIFDQIAEFEGVPPTHLRRLPLGDLTEYVDEFLAIGHNAPNLTAAGVWVSVDLFELQRIAANMAREFHQTTGEWAD